MQGKVRNKCRTCGDVFYTPDPLPVYKAGKCPICLKAYNRNNAVIRQRYPIPADEMHNRIPDRWMRVLQMMAELEMPLDGVLAQMQTEPPFSDVYNNR